MSDKISWKFVYLYNKEFKKDWGWRLKIETEEQLIKYFKLVEFPNHVLAIKSWQTDLHDGIHNTDRLSSVYDNLVRISGEVDAIPKLIADSVKVKIEIFKKFWHVLINMKGGVTFNNGKFEEKEEIKSKEIKFPGDYNKKDIRLIKWPAGVHYYAKIGMMDVVVDGMQKWKCKESAFSAARGFLADLRA